MPGFDYTICAGDTLGEIARRYRIEGGWQFIWFDSHNEELRGLRGGPEALCPGDRIYIPGVEGNTCETPSGVAADFSAPPPYRICAEDGSSAPPTAVPVCGLIRMKAVHDEGAQGTWQWGTTSTKITLSDETTDTVTITAGEHVSAGLAAEVIQLTFTPSGGAPTEASSGGESPEVSGEELACDATEEIDAGSTLLVMTRITVISVTFSVAAAHGYGFDGMGTNATDPTPDGETPHLSVKRNSRGKVLVTIAGGAGGGVLHFTSDDASIAEASTDGTPPAIFTLFIDGKSQDKAHTLIRARANSDDGPICASLAVNVYAEMSYSADVVRAWDSTSPSTMLSRPNFSVADTQTTVREAYKQTIATITLTDGGLLDVNFDPDGTGSLVLEAGRTSAGEQAITDRLGGTSTIVIVKSLRWLFTLGAAASIGDHSITLGTHIDADLMGKITPGTYTFGGPGNYEPHPGIRVTGADPATGVVTLASPLTKDHPVTEGIWWPLGGLSGNPAWVQEGTDNQTMVNRVIGHEFGHELLALYDLDGLECMMHFSNSRTGMKIRFKELPRHYTPPGGNESQWECISRP